MSRTHRNFEWWVDWSEGFDEKLQRGHARRSIRRVRRDGTLGVDEVWAAPGKRWNKRFRSKALRRLAKGRLQ